jgi:hypothetical protein
MDPRCKLNPVGSLEFRFGDDPSQPAPAEPELEGKQAKTA